MILFCLGIKNASYAVQPFSPEENTIVAGAFEEEPTLLEKVADYFDMDLGGEGKELFYYRVDKQRPTNHQFRFAQEIEKTGAEFIFRPVDTRAVIRFKGTDRKFSLPPHHHFLFRLTPF